LRVTGEWQRDAKRQDSLLIESEIGAADRPIAADEQHRPGHQHERDGDFTDDQRRADTAPAHATTRLRRRLTQRRSRVGVAGAPRRHERDDERRDRRQPDREQEHRAVEIERDVERHLRREEETKRGHAGDGEHGANRAAGDSDDGALGEHLSREASASGAQGDADGELAVPRRSTSEHQVGDVGARNEEHEAAGAEHDEERSGEVAGEVLADRDELRDPPPVVPGELGREPRRDRVEIGAGLGDGDAGAEPPDRAGVDAVAVRLAHRIGDERDPQLAAIRKAEPRGHDPDDGMRGSVDRDRAAEQVGAAEAALPEPVAEDDDVRSAVLLLLGTEGAADQRLHAEQGQEIGGHAGPLDALGPRLVGERVARPRPHAERGEGAVLRPPREVVGDRDVDVSRGAVDALRIDGDEPVGVRIGERPDEDRVDGAEDRRRHSDPQGDAGGGGHRERRAAPERATGESDILPHRVHPVHERPPPPTSEVDRHARIGDAGHVAELASGLRASGVARHPAGDEVVDARLDVEAKLVVHLAPWIAVEPEEPAPLVDHAGRSLAASTRPTAATNSPQLAVSARSCWRPRAVSR
jgi:hypothetical protein